MKSPDVQISRVDPTKDRGSSLGLSILGIALATPFLVWFAIGDLSFGGRGGVGQFHEFGPYDVGPSSGYLVGGVAALVALVSVGALIVRARRRPVGGWWWAVIVTLAAAGSVGAFGWRICTAGVGGANIGAGFAVLLGPPLIAELLAGAVWMAYFAEKASAPSRTGAERRRALMRASLLTLAAVLVIPAMYVLLYRL
jgi:hypothetical protein